MISLLEYTKTTKFPHYDYYLEEITDMIELLPNLMPKFEGQWVFVFVNPKIVDVKHLLGLSQFPEHIDVYIYLQLNKLNPILDEYPQYKPEHKTPYELYKEFLGTLHHPVDKRAVSYIYQAAQRNLDQIIDVLTKIDAECQTETISIHTVQKEFSYTRHIYTNQVLRELVYHSPQFHKHYNMWLNELGMSYAYNSMYKQVKQLLKDKHKYLTGKDVKNTAISKIDGVSISTLYSLFVNSTSYKQLESILYLYWNLTGDSYRKYMKGALNVSI